jgi:hypothetical protein
MHNNQTHAALSAKAEIMNGMREESSSGGIRTLIIMSQLEIKPITCSPAFACSVGFTESCHLVLVKQTRNCEDIIF